MEKTGEVLEISGMNALYPSLFSKGPLKDCGLWSSYKRNKNPRNMNLFLMVFFL